MIIAVASGKGGTGKTTVAANLALALRDQHSVQAVDCDVEGPNLALFLKPDIQARKEVGLLIPVVEGERCTLCGTCAEVCQFHAIAVLGQDVLVFPELCHGCGSCALTCPENAITEVMRPMGVVEEGFAGQILFHRGVLNIGEAMAVPVIHELKKEITNREVIILDAPPGASCPVVESLQGADVLLLVTEPTPFGMHDLANALEIARTLDIPCGVIINRATIGDDRVEKFCAQHKIPILLQIPHDVGIARAYSRGVPMIEKYPRYRAMFLDLYRQARQLQEGKL